MAKVVHRVMLLVIVLAAGVAAGQDAELCGDADGDGAISVTDGVQALRAAADLSTLCINASCDVDADGTMAVTDGVNVLRMAAGLAATRNCLGRDPFVNSVSDSGGLFAPIIKTPLIEPPDAPATLVVRSVAPKLVSGRINVATVEFDFAGVQAQGSETPNDLNLFVASASEDGTASPGVFALPLAAPKDTVSVAIELREDVDVQLFKLRFANAAGTTVVGRVEEYNVIVIRESSELCGNNVFDGEEACDPPGSPCGVSNAGTCTGTCECDAPATPTPVPTAGARFIDNGLTVTDTQTGLEWEKKLTKPGSGPDPFNQRDVDNTYVWTGSGTSDDGPLFKIFLRVLNQNPCFAGHCDWRIPTVSESTTVQGELQTIVDRDASACGFGGPCIHPIFGPTMAGKYWSRTTPRLLGNPSEAGFVSFFNGTRDFVSKNSAFHARAVRGP